MHEENDNDDPQPLKRFKSAKKDQNIVKLREGFHWEGDYPRIIENSKGEIVLISKCVVDCPGNEYFFQHIHRKSATVFVCLLCPPGSPASRHSTGLSPSG